MNSRGATPASTSPRRCRISAHPPTRSMFAALSAIPSRAYWLAAVDPSLSRPNPAAPAPNPGGFELAHDVHLPPKHGEELPGGNIPLPIQPGRLLPPAQPLQHPPVLRIIETVIVHPRRDKPRVRFLSVPERNDEPPPIPSMTNPPRIGRRVNARTPIRLAGPRARRNILVLPARQGRCLLNADHVVFQSQVGINVLLCLEMPRHNPR